MIKINVYYWNNGVGIVNDAILLKSVLKEYDVSSYDMSIDNKYRNSDLGIFIQNIWTNQFEKNKKNIYIVNEEWLNTEEILCLHKFDYIFTKSSYAKSLIQNYNKNVINIGFFSLDRYFFPKNTEKILHFKGKSIQKNTELIESNININIIDSEKTYLSNSEIIYQLNSHDIHICCSLYEAWGNYLWESMSCGKIVICSEIPVFKEYLDPNLVKFISTEKIIKFNINSRFLKETIYPFRQGYYVNRNIFEELMNNKEELFEFQKNNSDNIRKYFLDTNNKNKQKFLNTISFI